MSLAENIKLKLTGFDIEVNWVIDVRINLSKVVEELALEKQFLFV